MDMKKKPTPVSVRAGQVEFVKVNTDAWRWRDVYRWLLGLRWPQFAAFVASLYVGLNILFAALYSFQQGSIAGSTGGHWFFDCFFFSIQTLATVGYGHMYPQTLYGHIISTIEIMTGVFLLERVGTSKDAPSVRKLAADSVRLRGWWGSGKEHCRKNGAASRRLAWSSK